LSHACGSSNRPDRFNPDEREMSSNAFIVAGFISLFSITRNSWSLLKENE
jgi:hypothetical protein